MKPWTQFRRLFYNTVPNLSYPGTAGNALYRQQVEGMIVRPWGSGQQHDTDLDRGSRHARIPDLLFPNVTSPIFYLIVMDGLP